MTAHTRNRDVTNPCRLAARQSRLDHQNGREGQFRYWGLRAWRRNDRNGMR